MSILSAFGPAASALGGGSSSSGPATNSSINVSGVSGNTFSALNQLLDLARGPQQNGGFTQNVPMSSIRYQNPNTPNYSPMLLLGGIALVALLLWKRG